MMKDAEEFKKEDEERLECMEAKNKLENTIYQYKGMLDDEKVKSALPEEKHKEMHDQLSEYGTWLDDNQSATREEFDAKQSELEEVAKNIQEQLQQNMPSADAPGAPPGQGVPPAGGSNSEPTIQTFVNSDHSHLTLFAMDCGGECGRRMPSVGRSLTSNSV